MRAILPGQPQPKRQALSTAHWDGLRLVAYVSGNAAIILNGPQTILQTIYIDQVESLTAITIEELSGRIAICDEENVYIYQPVGRDEGVLRWVLVHELKSDHDNPKISSLSWGSSEECLVAGSRLSLWYIPENGTTRMIWQTILAYPLDMAYFSYDGGLIASCGPHDRLVKIWRRLSYEVDSTRFDVSYLSHPSTVVDLHWRRPWHAEQNADNLLYTVCPDQCVRVWSYSDPHSLSLMELVATVDLKSSIQPRRLSVGSISDRRYAFVVDSRDFSETTEKAVSTAPNSTTVHALEHLIEIANRSPEIIVVLDGLGHMCVWGLENTGVKGKKSMIHFNIALVDEVKIHIPRSSNPLEDYTRFCVFSGGETPASLSILVQSYSGVIDWYDSPITKFFDTSPREDRVLLRSSLSGHDSSIDRIIRSADGGTVLSWTDDNDVIVWKHRIKDRDGLLVRHNAFQVNEEIMDAVLLGNGEFVLLLQDGQLELWDVQYSTAQQVALEELPDDSDAMSLMIIHTSSQNDNRYRIAVLAVDSTIEYWEVDTGTNTKSDNHLHRSGQFNIDLRGTVLSESGADLIYSDDNPSVSEGNRTPKDGPVAVSREGNMKVIQFSPVPETVSRISKVDVIETLVSRPAILSSSGYGKIAVADSGGTALSIWDMKTATWEYYHQFSSNEKIETLSWARINNGTLILAVCFPYHINVLAPRISTGRASDRFWYQVRNYRIRDFSTQLIGDMCWLQNGDILVGTGNQLFVLDAPASETNGVNQKTIDGDSQKHKSATRELQEVNTERATFHAIFVKTCMAMGHLSVARQVLQSLQKQLKFFAEGDVLSDTLHWQPEDLVQQFRDSSSESARQGQFSNGLMEDEDDHEFDTASSGKLVESLDSHHLHQLTQDESNELKDTVQMVLDLSALEKSVDAHALRYIHALCTTGDEGVGWDAITFASISTSQEILVDTVTRHFGGKLDWPAARKSGLFLWLSDREALRTHMENVARSEYTKHEDRNPVDCSLYYLALNKKNVLQGLWRMTSGVKEKENTLRLLANNFNDPRWKATALKNAYALLSKRRFEYAAAFFLLGNSLKDAVNVCIHQMNDLQLAIAIARIYDQDDSTLNDILEKKVLPQSILSTQARWMASWAYKTMNQPQKAIQVLVRPIHSVIGQPLQDLMASASTTESTSSPPASLNTHTNDPILTIFYKHLRGEFLAKNQWTTTIIEPQEEFSFVLKSALALKRRGLTLLSLALLSSWEFVPYSYSTKSDVQKRRVSRASFSQEQFTPAAMGRRMSFNLAAFDTGLGVSANDVVSREEGRGEGDGEAREKDKVNEGSAKTGLKMKPPPTQFVEPDASSLLDSFGF